MRDVTVVVLNTDGDKEPNTVWVFNGHLSENQARFNAAQDCGMTEADLEAQGTVTVINTVVQG